MARSKTQAGLIKNRRTRRLSLKSRREGFLQKAKDLATLSGVSVAVVCICADPPKGAPPTTVEESVPGVLDRYRALPARRRGRPEHTHLGYLEDLLTKEKAKLAKLRRDGSKALAPPHEGMSLMTMEELRRVHDTVDGTVVATAERRRALGLGPGGDDDAVVVLPSGPWTAAVSNDSDDAGLLVDQGMAIWQGLQAQGGGMIPLRELYHGHHPDQMNMPTYDPQFNGGYQQQMPMAPGASFQPQYTMAQPDHGRFQIQYDDGISSHVGTSSSSSMQQVLSNGNFNNGADLSIWSPDESSNPNFNMHTGGNGNTPAAEYLNESTFQADARADIGVGGSGMNYLGGGGYETQGSSNDLSIWSAHESIAGYTSGGNTPAAGYMNDFTTFPGAPADIGGVGGNGGMNYSQFKGGYETQGSSNDLQRYLLNDFITFPGAPGDIAVGGNGGMNYLGGGGYERQGSSNDLQYSSASASQNSSSVEELFWYGSDE